MGRSHGKTGDGLYQLWNDSHSLNRDESSTLNVNVNKKRTGQIPPFLIGVKYGKSPFLMSKLW